MFCSFSHLAFLVCEEGEGDRLLYLLADFMKHVVSHPVTKGIVAMNIELPAKSPRQYRIVDREVILVAAISANRVIGCRNMLPWHCSADMQHFRRTTKGHAIVVGRKTYETFQVRPLPDRLNLVLTRRSTYIVAEGVIVCTSLAEALQHASDSGSEKVFVIGGGQVYGQALSLVDKMILTHLPIHAEGDVYFPVWDEGEWEVVEERREGDLVFRTYVRASCRLQPSSRS